MTLPQVTLPPYARRLDVRATRAAFAAGTLGTVGDHPSGEDVQVGVELRHADRHNADDVEHGDHSEASRWSELARPIMARGFQNACAQLVAEQAALREFERQKFLRRVQYVDPRERRA